MHGPLKVGSGVFNIPGQRALEVWGHSSHASEGSDGGRENEDRRRTDGTNAGGDRGWRY